MSDKIAQRIAKELGIPDLVEILSEKLSGADLHSLLLAVLKRRVRRIRKDKLLAQNSVSNACNLDGRSLNKLETVAYESAAEFEALDLSPLAPLGAVSILTGLDQSNVLSTTRSFECASDPTLGMALECARRRKNQSDRKAIHKLATNHRLIRFPLPDNPAYSAHFKLFSLVTAGRDIGSGQFERNALKEHIGVYLSFISKLQNGDYSFADAFVEISDTRVVAEFCSKFGIDREEIRARVRARDSNSADKLLSQHSNLWPKLVNNPKEELAKFELPNNMITHLDLMKQTVCDALQVAYPNVQFRFNMHRLTGLGYYEGPCFHIKIKNRQEQQFMLADGGFVNWTQVLLSDEKERLMTSAIGIELICRLFRRA